jgi:hypothetical protein
MTSNCAHGHYIVGKEMVCLTFGHIRELADPGRCMKCAFPDAQIIRRTSVRPLGIDVVGPGEAVEAGSGCSRMFQSRTYEMVLATQAMIEFSDWAFMMVNERCNSWRHASPGTTHPRRRTMSNCQEITNTFEPALLLIPRRPGGAGERNEWCPWTAGWSRNRGCEGTRTRGAPLSWPGACDCSCSGCA